jgi:hypothetical protein
MHVNMGAVQVESNKTKLQCEALHLGKLSSLAAKSISPFATEANEVTDTLAHEMANNRNNKQKRQADFDDDYREAAGMQSDGSVDFDEDTDGSVDFETEEPGSEPLNAAAAATGLASVTGIINAAAVNDYSQSAPWTAKELPDMLHSQDSPGRGGDLLDQKLSNDDCYDITIEWRETLQEAFQVCALCP